MRAYERRRNRRWSGWRSAAFGAGLTAGVLAIAPPLESAAERAFAPHMWQHLILTELSAPLLLLGAPLLLALGALPPQPARVFVRVLRAPVVRAATFPPVTWCAFVLTLWLVHFTPFFEAALQRPWLHALEHACFLTAALLFWLPLIPAGPTPWTDSPLAYPLRMLYLFLAMPAEAFLGFAIYGQHHIMFAHYARAGIRDQHAAGELMWVGGSLVMFVAFMLTGVEWAKHERRLAERYDRRADAVAPAK